MIRTAPSPSIPASGVLPHLSALPNVGQPESIEAWVELVRGVGAAIELRAASYPPDLPAPELLAALLHSARSGAEGGRTVEELSLVLLPLQRFAALQTSDPALSIARGMVDDALSAVIAGVMGPVPARPRRTISLSLADRIESNCHTLFHSVRLDLIAQRCMVSALRGLFEPGEASMQQRLMRLVPLARRLVGQGDAEARALSAIGDLWECAQGILEGGATVLDRRKFQARLTAWWKHAVISAALRDLYPPEQLAGAAGMINAGALRVNVPPELPVVPHAREVRCGRWREWCQVLAEEGVSSSELFRAVHAWMEREVVIYHGRWQGEVCRIAEGVLSALTCAACGMSDVALACLERASARLHSKQHQAVLTAHRTLDLVSLYVAEFHRSGDQKMLDEIRPTARRSLVVLGGADGNQGAEGFLEDYLWRLQWYEGDLRDSRWRSTLEGVVVDFRNFCGNTTAWRADREQRFLTLLADKFLHGLNEGSLAQLREAVSVQTPHSPAQQQTS